MANIADSVTYQNDVQQEGGLEVRLKITREVTLDQLILAAPADNIQVQREVEAALVYISLIEENKLEIARSVIYHL